MVAVIKPPIITIANGFWDSEPIPELNAAGNNPIDAINAVITTGRVRRLISKGKCTGREWLDVMRAAHQLNITTSATMMPAT